MKDFLKMAVIPLAIASQKVDAETVNSNIDACNLEVAQISGVFEDSSSDQKYTLLKELENCDQSHLREIKLQILQDIQSGIGAKVSPLLAKIETLLGERSELVPEYPVNNKIAILINGDSYEKRHVDNINQSIVSLKSRGFTNIYLIQDAKPIEVEGISIQQFSATQGGVKSAFEQLSLEKDDLVFLYVTGHGSSQNGEATIGLRNNDELRGSKLIEYLDKVKTSESRLIANFDQCYSGFFRNIIDQAHIPGMVSALAEEGEVSYCHLFAPEYWRKMIEKYDPNKDGFSTAQEIFSRAIKEYTATRGVEEYGEFAKSPTEITLENYSFLVESGKPVIIDMSATWCAPCRILEQEISGLYGIIGDQVNVATITTDKNPEYQALLEKLGLDKIQVFPSVYIVENGEARPFFTGVKTSEEILSMVNDELGISIDFEPAIYDIVEKTGIDEDVVRAFFSKGVRSVSAIQWYFKNKISPHGFEGKPRFTGNLEIFLGYRVPYEKALKYDERFTIYDIATLVGSGISNEEALEYDERFTGHDISNLVRNGILNEEAIKYDERFDGNNISFFISGRVSSEFANAYDKKFIGHDVYILVVRKVSSEIANTYDERFRGYDVSNLVDRNISNEEAIKYDERFGGDNVSFLISKDISSDLTNAYNPRFTGNDIVSLVRNNISNEEALKYDLRFTGYDISTLIANKISNEEALKYDKRFNGDNISFFISKEILSELTNGYDQRLRGDDIVFLIDRGISNEEVLKYDLRRFRGHDIISLINEEISSELANTYNERFTADDIIKLVASKISNEEAIKYGEFNVYSIIRWYKEGLIPIKNPDGNGYRLVPKP